MPQFNPQDEIRGARHWNAKTFIAPNGQVATEFHAKWVHFLDTDGSWKDIEGDSFVDAGTHFVFDKAPFIAKIPKTSTGIAEFISNNRWDIFEKKTIDDAPFSQSIKALGIADVPGVVETGDLGWGVVKYIVYKGAYPTLNADLIYWIHHGRAPRLNKLVRFNSNPNVAQDLRLEFELTYSDNHEVKQYKDTLSPTDLTQIKSHLKRARDIEALKKKELFTDVMLAELAAHDVRRKIWDKTSKLITQKGISHKPIGAVGRRGVGIKDFTIWDNTSPLRKQRVTVEYENLGSSYKLTKILPKAYLDAALYPVYTDASSTFFPDPDPETTSVDGVLQATATNSWATQRARTSCDTVVDNTNAERNVRVITNAFGSNISFDRGCFLFDTSSLGSGASVTAATISFWFTESLNNYTTDPQWNVVGCAPASNTGLVTGDFDVATKWTMTAYITAVNTGGITTGAYTDYTINAAGQAVIAITGITKYGTVIEADRSNTDPSQNSKTSRMTPTWAEAAGTSNDPKLVVTYSTSITFSVNDAITVSESVTFLVYDFPNVNDSVTVSESVVMTVVDRPNVNDSITVSESFTFQIVNQLSVSDSITVSESVTIFIPILTPSVNDSITVTESTPLTVFDFPNVNDTITVSESVTMLIPILKPIVNDSVSVSEWLCVHETTPYPLVARNSTTFTQVVRNSTTFIHQSRNATSFDVC